MAKIACCKGGPDARYRSQICLVDQSSVIGRFPKKKKQKKNPFQDGELSLDAIHRITESRKITRCFLLPRLAAFRCCCGCRQT